MRKSLIAISLSTLSLSAPGVAVASPPEGVPSPIETIRDWYCGSCFDTFRRESQRCFDTWADNPLMQLRCLNGPRHDFLRCIAYCPWSAATINEIMALYDDGLLDSWEVVEAIEALAG